MLLGNRQAIPWFTLRTFPAGCVKPVTQWDEISQSACFWSPPSDPAFVPGVRPDRVPAWGARLRSRRWRESGSMP